MYLIALPFIFAKTEAKSLPAAPPVPRGEQDVEMFHLCNAHPSEVDLGSGLPVYDCEND
jgi:hypothetical protein